tara:strand:- start:268 stop:780 length:513 start_codon:yes stop_codon:yes gene_type:complete
MNRFIIDHHPAAIAKSLCDQHIVKMPLEEAQMLSTAVRHHAGDEYADDNNIYKTAYMNHPCTIWARECRENYVYAVVLLEAMSDEYTHRYGKVHKSSLLLPAFKAATEYVPPNGEGLTAHPQCFSGFDQLKTNELWPITAYRRFYRVDKLKFARYNKGREMPHWLEQSAA